MKLRPAVAALLLFGCPAFAQQTQKQQPQPKPQNQAAAGPLGIRCPQVLAMSSTDYIAKIVASNPSNVAAHSLAIGFYGRCYDARTDQLAAALARKGTGPKKAALANLKDFQATLDAFTARALADFAPASYPLKAAYAALYAKQFRFEFYQSYEPTSSKSRTPAKSSASAPEKNTQAPSQSTSTAPSSPPPAENPADLPAAPKAPLEGVSGVPKRKVPVVAPAPPPAPTTAPDATTPSSEPAPREIDPFTKAKNHFGELLGLLPEDKMHEVHSAFGKLFSGNPVSEDLKVQVYEYAIFLLEKPSEKPFLPPPF